MFELNGFNQRLQSLRKGKKWTQEELADFLNVSGQAVSKWETGQSYPDITIMPTLAGLFGVDMDYLFGKKQSTQPAAEIPASYNGLPLVHSNENVACYSSKEVKFADGPAVSFTDGSTAELTGRLVINNGPGEIKLVSLNKLFGSSGQSTERQVRDYQFGSTDSVYVEVMNNNCRLSRSDDGNCRVHAEGFAEFLDRLKIWEENAVLNVAFEHQSNNNNNQSSGENRVTVELPFNKGKNCTLKLNGSGIAEAAGFYFEKGELNINGSGSIKAGSFGTAIAKINGSGDIYVHAADTAVASINGSGDMYIGEDKSLSASINGSGDISLIKLSGQNPVDIRINGSGDVKIKEGQCTYFKAEISGSGDIDAAGVTAQESEIIIHQSGEVTLGRVMGTSREQIKQEGVIKILTRG